MTDQQTLTRDNDVGSEAERTRTDHYYSPNVDILEQAEELVLVAEMPGVAADGIDIDFENGELTLHGRVANRHEGREFLLREYGLGDYQRTFRVSERIDPTRISAEYGNGVLTVRLPKVEAAKPRKINVKAN
jgi:HSP20 family protein